MENLQIINQDNQCDPKFDSNRQFVIFDLDGTLIDSLNCVLDSINQALDEMHLDKVSIENSSAQSVDELFRFCKKHIGDKNEYAKFKNKFDSYHKKTPVERMKVIPRGYQMLNLYLSKGVLAIILTNKRQCIADRICSQLFPSDKMVIIGRRSIRPLKNNSMEVVKRLQSKELLIERCIHYFGDSETDARLSAELNIPYTKL